MDWIWIGSARSCSSCSSCQTKHVRSMHFRLLLGLPSVAYNRRVGNPVAWLGTCCDAPRNHGLKRSGLKRIRSLRSTTSTSRPLNPDVELAVGKGNLLLDLGANLERFDSTYFSPAL